jgi:hypothetical protein
MKRLFLLILTLATWQTGFAQLTAASFLTKYNDSGTGLYRAGQVAGAIGSDDHRSLVTDLNASVPFLTNTTNTFTGSLGIGATPGYHLDISASGAGARILSTNSDSPLLVLKRSGGTASEWQLYGPGGSTDLRFYSGADRFTFTTGGNFTATGTVTAATLNASALSTSGVIYSSVYTPTATSIANLDGTSMNDVHYVRIGNQVIMSGQFDADATAASSTTTRFRITIPVSTDFVGPDQAGGSGNFQGVAGQAVSVYADTSNEQIIFHWLAQSTANQSFTWIVKYLVQ